MARRNIGQLLGHHVWRTLSHQLRQGQIEVTAKVREISPADFVIVAELLDHAFEKAPAIPDHLMHLCNCAEDALLARTGRSAFTADKALARMLGISHRA